MVYTAGIFLINPKNELLIVHPTNAPNNMWSIPKGIMENGEGVVETSYRELFEETNIDALKLNAAYVFSGDKVPYKSSKKTLCPLFMKVTSGYENIELRCNSLVDGLDFYENDKIEWVPIEKALKLIHPTQVIALKASKLI